jgi:hypothetical protein
MPELEHQKEILMRLALCISQWDNLTPPVSSEMLLSVPTSVPTPGLDPIDRRQIRETPFPTSYLV